MCTYQEYFTICEVVKRLSGSSIWSVICPRINDLIDCKPVAVEAADAQVGGACHGATARGPGLLLHQRCYWRIGARLGHTVSTVIRSNLRSLSADAQLQTIRAGPPT